MFRSSLTFKPAWKWRHSCLRGPATMTKVSAASVWHWFAESPCPVLELAVVHERCKIVITRIWELVRIQNPPFWLLSLLSRASSSLQSSPQVQAKMFWSKKVYFFWIKLMNMIKISYMKNYMQIRVYEEGRSPKEQNQLGYLPRDCWGGHFSEKLEKAGREVNLSCLRITPSYV